MRLPDGRAGQAAAVALTLLLVLVVWAGIIAPALGWYASRGEMLVRRQAMARRMAALVETLPDLRRMAEASGQARLIETALLPGATDALAAASLQQTLNERAVAAGVTVSSQEILPPQAAAGHSQVTVRIAASAPYRSLVAFLLALAESDIPMVVTELQLRGLPMQMIRGPEALEGLRADDPPVEATLTVLSFRDSRAGGG